MPIHKHGQPILTLDDWLRLAPPKSAGHWKDGRSAKETARAWLGSPSPTLPPEVAAALAGHPAFGPTHAWTAEPEVRLPFDSLPGEPRNTDLLVQGRDERGPFLLAVEAKADEPFGETVAATLRAARQRLAQNPRSGGVLRVQQLLTRLFGTSLEAEPALAGLRYQLLTATAGALTLAERHPGQRVVLLIHELVTPATSDAAHARNAADLDAFTTRLTGGRFTRVPTGAVCGPIPIAALPRGTGLYLAKVSRNLRPPPPR